LLSILGDEPPFHRVVLVLAGRAVERWAILEAPAVLLEQRKLESLRVFLALEVDKLDSDVWRVEHGAELVAVR
jgi:hypothetical protein